MQLTDFQWDKHRYSPRVHGYCGGLSADNASYFRKLADGRTNNDARHYCFRDAGKGYTYLCWLPAQLAPAMYAAVASPVVRDCGAFDPDFVPLDISEQPYDFLGH